MADIQKRLEKAEKYLQKGKQQEALTEYMEILKEYPANESARQTAADICLTLGLNEEAAELLTVLFDKYAASGDSSKAIVQFKKLIKVGNPTNDQKFRFAQFNEKSDRKHSLELYAECAAVYDNAGQHREALAAYKRAVLIDPNSAIFHKRLGELAEQLNDKKAASESYTKMAELDPENTNAWKEKAFLQDASNPITVYNYTVALLSAGQFEDVIRLTEPYSAGPASTPEFREVYARALVGAKRPAEAEPFILAIFDKDPSRVGEIAALLGMLIDIQDTLKATHLAQKVEQNMAKHNKRKEFIAMVQGVVAEHLPGPEFLEYLTHVYNSANRETDFCATLNQLFQLYYAAGNFLKAGEALDRICDVNPYDPGNAKNLDLLKGKLDSNRFNAIANRLQQVGAGAAAQTDGGGGDGEPATGGGAKDDIGAESTVLEDFILQAEIFMQYGMRTKAVERLERIHKVFPREEDKNERLRALYNNAGFIPKYEAPAAPPPPTTGTPVSPFGQAPSYGTGGAAAGPAVLPQLSNDENAVDNFTRVTEITRNIYRQSTVKGVLFAAVNDVGRHYNASRCVAGLITPGKSPTAALEYCSPGVKQSDVQHIVKLLGALTNASVVAAETGTGIVAIDNAPASPDMQDVLPSLTALGVKSLLAAPLIDATNDEHVGLLMLQQCDQERKWRPTEGMVLKTIADQMVQAVNNAKLRSLMKNLAVTDEKSGLLKRASYIDVLLGETQRALQQNSTASLILISFGKATMLVKEIGEAGVEAMMQQIGQTLVTQVRQNDVAVRYDMTTAAIILPDTTDKNAFFVVEKMRKAFSGQKVPGIGRAVDLCVGIAEMVMQAQYEPVDIVTEVINRAEIALEGARAEGPNSAKSLAPQYEAAVA